MADALAKAPDRGITEGERAHVAELRADSMPASTRRQYRRAFKRFAEWCQGKGLAFLPAEPLTMAGYLAYAEKEGLAIATILVEAAAINKAHVMSGLDSPRYHAEVREVLRGIALRQAGRKTGEKAAVSIALLERFVATLPYSLTGDRDKALLLVGWAAALRRSEIVNLDYEDVQWTDDGAVLRIRRSKTDQLGKGAFVAIHTTDRLELCPVRALRSWLERARISTGPVFRVVRSNRNGERALSRRLNSEYPRVIVKQSCERVGINGDRFGAHSLRAGFITAAAEAGKPIHEIQLTTRHKDVNTLLGYIRPTEAMQRGAGKGLLDRRPPKPPAPAADAH